MPAVGVAGSYLVVAESGALKDDRRVARVKDQLGVAGSLTDPPRRLAIRPAIDGRSMTDSHVLLAAMTQPTVDPRVSILGTVEVSGGGRTTSLPGVNLPALLSMLALTPGRPVLNERLIDALWPDADPARGRRSLISLVHQLNAALSAHMGLGRAVVSVKSVGRALPRRPRGDRRRAVRAAIDRRRRARERGTVG